MWGPGSTAWVQMFVVTGQCQSQQSVRLGTGVGHTIRGNCPGVRPMGGRPSATGRPGFRGRLSTAMSGTNVWPVVWPGFRGLAGSGPAVSPGWPVRPSTVTTSGGGGGQYVSSNLAVSLGQSGVFNFNLNVWGLGIPSWGLSARPSVWGNCPGTQPARLPGVGGSFACPIRLSGLFGPWSGAGVQRPAQPNGQRVRQCVRPAGVRGPAVSSGPAVWGLGPSGSGGGGGGHRGLGPRGVRGPG